VSEITKLSMHDVILYNNPELVEGPRRKNIRTSILKKISYLRDVKAIKDSSASIKRLANYVRATKENKFAVLQGDETNIATAYAFGAVGAVPSMANLFPNIFVKMHKLRDDFEEVSRYQDIVNSMYYFVYARREKITGSIKNLLCFEGIISSDFVRNEKQRLEKYEVEFIERNYQRMIDKSSEQFLLLAV